MEKREFLIRPMVPTDLPAALALWRGTEGIGLNESDTPDALAAFLARNPAMSCVATLEDGGLVGAVLCGHDGRRGYLHHLAVVRAHRRHGVAGALLQHCFGRLAEGGILKCNLFLYADNVEGEQFWLRQGWNHRRDLQVLQKPVSPR